MGRNGIVKKIVLGVIAALLLSGTVWAADSGSVAVEVLSRTGSSWDGDMLPAYPTGKAEITILKIIIPAGVKLPRHRHPVINAGVLLRGELTVVTDEGKTLHLKAGDSLVEVVNRWHYGVNEGSVAAEIIVFYAGTPGCPITVKDEGAVPPGDTGTD
jgi:quercetin dioxygenase-like cupin family protein